MAPGLLGSPLLRLWLMVSGWGALEGCSQLLLLSRNTRPEGS